MAASMLRRAGFDRVADLVGGLSRAAGAAVRSISLSSVFQLRCVPAHAEPALEPVERQLRAPGSVSQAEVDLPPGDAEPVARGAVRVEPVDRLAVGLSVEEDDVQRLVERRARGDRLELCMRPQDDPGVEPEALLDLRFEAGRVGVDGCEDHVAALDVARHVRVAE